MDQPSVNGNCDDAVDRPSTIESDSNVDLARESAFRPAAFRLPHLCRSGQRTIQDGPPGVLTPGETTSSSSRAILPRGGQGWPLGPSSRSILIISDIEVDTTVQQLIRNIDHELHSSLTSLGRALAVPGDQDKRRGNVRAAGRLSLLLGRGVD
jgi:hypothetical protein